MVVGLIGVAVVANVARSVTKKRRDKMSDNGKGSRSNLYGVFIGEMRTSRWVMTRNRKRAVKLAREHGGFVRVRKDDPDVSSFDRPTFIATSDPIPSADFRKKASKAGFKKGNTSISQRSLDRG